MVHLVEIKVIGPQSPKALLAGALDVQGRQPRLIRPVAHPPIDLCREHDLLAPSATLCEPSADDLFGHAFAQLPAIDVGRVEEVEAQF